MLKRKSSWLFKLDASDEANQLYEKFNKALNDYGINVQTGEFGTDMEVEIINDGPVTIIYESQDGKIL